jgi:beta-N-acetylhexosaminidase
MDLRKMLGQLFLLGFQGQEISKSSPIVADIKERNLGGVLLFDRLLAKNLTANNIFSASQVKNLTDGLQSYSGNRLLIGVDQEGGKVCRLTQKGGFPVTASPSELGEINDIVLTEMHAATVAHMLKRLGINLNLAPVVDLNIFPDSPIIGALGRSFSSDAEQVVRHAKAWIQAHGTCNILSCLKHFPGHGSAHNDSHLGFVDISETWNKKELQPFSELIKQGLADAVMTGHLFNSILDSRYPATLSQNIITGLLRRELRYDGVVISDDIQMKAISDLYGLEETLFRAFSAGVDMIIIGNNLDYAPDILERALQATIRCLQKGYLKEEQLIAALRRVQRLKDRHFSGAAHTYLFGMGEP